MSFRKLISLALGFGVLAVSAGADTLSFDSLAYGGTATDTTLNEEVYVGLYNMTFTPTVGTPYNLLAYCTDLTILNVSPYGSIKTTTANTPYSAAVGDQIAWIVNKYGDTTDATQAIETQLAIWDAVSGSSAVATDLTGLPSADYSTAASWASTAVLDATSADVATFYKATPTGGSQNFVEPVPEPVTTVLAISGLCVAARKRLGTKSA